MTLTAAPSNRAGTGSDAKRNLLLFVVAVAVCLIPVSIVRYVPLVDLPGHLGRLYILQHYSQNPDLQQHYAIVRGLLPNMLIDLFSPLQAWLTMPDVGRLFVITSIVLFALGCALLSRALYGVITPLAAFAVLSQYNSMFFFGYVQFQSGVGLFLVTLALWMRWRRHFSAFRLAALALLSVLTYLAHLGGYAFIGLSTIFLLLLDWLRVRQLDRSALYGILALGGPVLLYLFAHGPYGNAVAPGWGPIYPRFTHLFIHLIGYNWMVDAPVAVVLLGAAAFSIGRGHIRIHPELGPLTAFFWVLYAIFPYSIGDGPDAYTRVLVAAVALTILAVRVDLPERTGRIVFSLALAALLVRMGYTGWVWTRQDRFIANNVAFFERIPVGARVFPIVPNVPAPLVWGFNEAKTDRLATHLLSWAMIFRGVITPSTFTLKGQHPVFNRLPDESGGYQSAQASDLNWPWIERNYDFLWYYGSDRAFLDRLAQCCEPVGAQGKGTLFRITKAE